MFGDLRPDVIRLLERDLCWVELGVANNGEDDREDGRSKSVCKHETCEHGVGLCVEWDVFLRVFVERADAIERELRFRHDGGVATTLASLERLIRNGRRGKTETASVMPADDCASVAVFGNTLRCKQTRPPLTCVPFFAETYSQTTIPFGPSGRYLCRGEDDYNDGRPVWKCMVFVGRTSSRRGRARRQIAFLKGGSNE